MPSVVIQQGKLTLNLESLLFSTDTSHRLLLEGPPTRAMHGNFCFVFVVVCVIYDLASIAENVHIQYQPL
jgi:hypothetical protein